MYKIRYHAKHTHTHTHTHTPHTHTRISLFNIKDLTHFLKVTDLPCISNLDRSPQKGDAIKDKSGNVVLFNDRNIEDMTGTGRCYGDVVYSKQGERIHDFFWDGVKPPWGCLWCGMWRHNVRALHECKQQAVVIYQCDKAAKPNGGEWAENDKPQWGVHMGLGNAQQGEVEWMRQEGIPIYAYTVDEYTELVALAEKKQKIPSSKLAGQGVRHVAA